MLNLHPPFRRLTADGEDRVAVEAEEDGRVTAALSGRPAGEVWRIERLHFEAARLDDLGPRILAVADALAAEEGLATVVLDPAGLDVSMLALLDREGFRPAAGSGLLSRPVIPSG